MKFLRTGSLGQYSTIKVPVPAFFNADTIAQ